MGLELLARVVQVSSGSVNDRPHGFDDVVVDRHGQRWRLWNVGLLIDGLIPLRVCLVLTERLLRGGSGRWAGGFRSLSAIKGPSVPHRPWLIAVSRIALR